MTTSDHHSPDKAFASFTDAAVMKVIFQKYLPGFSQEALSLDGCQVLHVRYRTYTKKKKWGQSYLAISYRLTATDQTTYRTDEQIIFAKAFLEGRSEATFHEAKCRSLVPPLIHVPALDAVIWAFPNDPHLPHLPQLMDPESVRHHLPYAHLPTAFDTPDKIAAIETEVVHYYPEQRCTTRYYLRAKPDRTPLILYGKTFKGDEGYDIYQRMQYLWQRSLPHFKVAQPLAYDDACKTIWVADQPGRPFTDLINRNNYQTVLDRVALGLVSLHQDDLTSSKTSTIEEHLHEIRDKTTKLSHAYPCFAEALLRLVEQLVEDVAHLTPVADCLIYGDFHTQQLLVNQGQIIFFDFDEFALGDPAQDIANFIVDLHFRDWDMDFAQTMATTFVEAYNQHANQPIPADRLSWHVRHMFITKAYRLYRRQAPALKERIERAIQFAQEYTKGR